MLRLLAFVLSIAVPELLSLPAQARQENFPPPLAIATQQEFTDGHALGVVSGAWVKSGGTFNSTSTCQSGLGGSCSVTIKAVGGKCSCCAKVAPAGSTPMQSATVANQYELA